MLIRAASPWAAVGMRDPDKIRADIRALTEFEQDYREYLHALEDEERTGTPYWHPRAQAEKRWNLIRQAPRVGQARRASGVTLTLTPPPFTGGPLLTDFGSQMLTHENPPWAAAPNRLQAPRMLLDSVVAAIGSLQVELEEAEEPGRTRSTPSRVAERSRRGWPTLVGRVRHVPLVLGVIADIGGAVAVSYAVGRFLGFW